MEVEVITEKNTVHKLTVSSTGAVRIKVAIGSSQEEHDRIVESFTNVAIEALKLNTGTLRGKYRREKDLKSIVLYNDSKTFKRSFILWD